MKYLVLTSLCMYMSCAQAIAQTSLWSEKDRQFLAENLKRTRDEIIRETENHTHNQWHFKENDTSWSIAQMVEHLGLYERTFNYERTIILQTTPAPQLLAVTRTDSAYLAWMNEPQPHVANKIHIPLGLLKGKDNLAFSFMEESC